jgi:hypothetical protein
MGGKCNLVSEPATWSGRLGRAGRAGTKKGAASRSGRTYRQHREGNRELTWLWLSSYLRTHLIATLRLLVLSYALYTFENAPLDC